MHGSHLPEVEFESKPELCADTTAHGHTGGGRKNSILEGGSCTAEVEFDVLFT